MPSRMFGTTDRKVVLSTLWVVVVFNYLYADFMILIFRPGAYEAMAARMSPSVALGATLVMELLLAMAFLSRVLEYSLNRRVNIIAGLVGTAFVGVTLSLRAPAAYLALSGIEIIGTLFIVWYAWTWRCTD
jgi:uncharacterized protein DUF6326